MFGNLGMGEMMIALVIVLVLFGAKRIPEISGSLGKGIREFKRNVNEVEGSIVGAVASPHVERVTGGAGYVARAAAADERPEPKRLL